MFRAKIKYNNFSSENDIFYRREKLLCIAQAGYRNALSTFWHSHYENTPMQYASILHGSKDVHFRMKNCNIYYFCLRRFLRVHTIYVLEQKQEKTYTPVNPSFTL